MMKINNLTYLQRNNYYTKNTQSKQIKSTNPNNRISYNKPSFRGIPLEKLYNEYNWYINFDKVPAIYSFLKIDAPKEVMNEFFKEILNTKDRSLELIDSIVNQKRNSQAIMDALKNKLGEDSSILKTFMPNSPYNDAYENYIETKYNTAGNICELLKIRPDWKESALLEKYEQLKGHKKLTIGNIPRQIPKNPLYQIIDYLKDKMEIGVKPNKKIDNLIIDGKTYEFKFFTEGKSSKNVFGLFVPSVAKKFVIKMDEPKNRSLDAPFALGTLAKIDGYLTSNASRNSAPLYYYDHENNFSVYKYIEHSHVKEDTHNIQTIREKLPDFKALGLYYNDTVGFKNFFELNERSLDTSHKMEGYNEAINKAEWISVDNDHVTYSSQLNPYVSKFHNSLPNAMQMFF